MVSSLASGRLRSSISPRRCGFLSPARCWMDSANSKIKCACELPAPDRRPKRVPWPRPLLRTAKMMSLCMLTHVVRWSVQSCGGLGDANDWLTSGCAMQSGIKQTQLSDGSASFVLSNGIVSRTLIANKTTGLLCTTSLAIMAPYAEKLNHPAPECLFSVNGVAVVVGGSGTTSSDTRPRAKFVGMRSSPHVRAGGFHWVPGARGSNPNTAWPPKGLQSEWDHSLRCSDVHAGSGMLLTTTVLELYDQTASFGRRVKLSHNCSEPLYVFNMSISVLNILRDRDITTATDASVARGSIIHDPLVDLAYSSLSYLAPPTLANYGPGLSDWKATDEPFESFFVAETVHDVPYKQPPAVGRGFSRYGLVAARMTRTLSPQCEQNPIKVSGYCVGGRVVPPPDGQEGSAGAWCYDDEGTKATKALLAQCAEAGVEMFVFPQNMNGTWRSMVGNEFPTPANTTWMKRIVDIAHAGGIEVGAYQLLLNARSATAANQAAPGNAASLPNRGYDCMDPTTKLPDHNSGREGCQGGPGCSALCGATEFYDQVASLLISSRH